MQIAIIGAGNAGGAISEAAVRHGHKVTITSDHVSNAEKVASITGAKAVPSNAEAVEDAEVVVLAIPIEAVTLVVEELRNHVAGKTIIDATNPLNPTYTDLTTTTKSAAEELQELLPDASVVKAFNTVFATEHGNPKTDGFQLDGLYAGDDEGAKETVANLLTEFGFRAIDAGSLRMARSLEEMAFLNISLNARNGWPWQTSWKLVGPSF